MPLGNELPRMNGTYLRRRGFMVGAHPPMIEKLSSRTHHMRAFGVSAGLVSSE